MHPTQNEQKQKLVCLLFEKIVVCFPLEIGNQIYILHYDSHDEQSSYDAAAWSPYEEGPCSMVKDCGGYRPHVSPCLLSNVRPFEGVGWGWGHNNDYQNKAGEGGVQFLVSRFLRSVPAISGRPLSLIPVTPEHAGSGSVLPAVYCSLLSCLAKPLHTLKLRYCS
jgi:hypothetical protein